MAEHVLLVGMMGAGKTTIGRIVAGRLRRPFWDSDAEVVARTGRTVPEIFAERGEAAFRAEERMALALGLCRAVPSVIAVAGGAVFDPDSRRRMRVAGMTVWLRAAPPTLAVRVGSGQGRPLLGGSPAEVLQRLDAFRRPVYQHMADAVVDVDGCVPHQIAERVGRLARDYLEGR
ncbi:MAG: shikimate kinase [Acidimicrobiales bacterium]